MTRQSAFVLLLAAGTVSVTASAYQNPPVPKVVEAQKLKDNLYMLTGAGGGGNTAVFIGTSGVTVVDTKNPEWGAPILAKIKELTPKPVTTIINTHTHGDHVSGNVEFPATVEVIVQENTTANMEKMNIFKQNNERGLPKRSFKDKLSIGSGADQIDLYYFGRGHTNGDAFVVFPALRVMHAGDIFSGKNLPLLDGNNGGSGLEIGDSLTKAADGVRNIDAIITGHSTVMTVADLREHAQFNKDFVSDVRAGLAAGKSPADIAASWKVNEAKYKGYTAQEARVKSNVELVANELKK
jgi:glyoxylase-like metal-dependent hydrolase (beta-lactamase superfamily II)